MLRMTKDEYSTLFGEKKKSKYGNRKCEWMGIKFDSIRERDRFIILDEERKCGRITDLRRQVRYQLIPPQKDGKKLIGRGVSYVADFTYKDSQGNLVVEDAKGYRGNRVWIIKKQLMFYIHGIDVIEV